MGLRALLGTLFRVFGVLVLVAVSLVAHLATPVGRKAARDIVLAVLPQTVPGKVSLRSIDALSPSAIHITGLSYRDDRGDRILDDATVVVEPTTRLVRGLFSGDPLPPVIIHARKLWIRQPYFNASARPRVETPAPPPSEPSRRVTRLPLVSIVVDEVASAVPGLDLTGRTLTIEAGLVASAREVALDVRRVSAVLQPLGLGYERLEASARLNLREPLGLEAALDLRGPALRCHLDARTDARGVLTVTARPCDLASFGLDRLARRGPDDSLGTHLLIEEATLQGPLAGPWTARVNARANDQPFELDARLDGVRQVVDVHTHHLSLDQASAGLPPSDLDGTVHFEREAIPHGQRLVLDAAGLQAAVRRVPLPPARAAVRIERRVVTLEEVRADSIGLVASGTVNPVDGEVTFDARAHLDVPDVAPFPWVAGRAAGRVRMDLRAHGRGDQIEATVSGEAQGLRVDNVRATTARLDARASYNLRARALRVESDLAATALRVPGAVGPTDVSARVTGDPRAELAVDAHARGDGLLAVLGAPNPATARGPTAVSTHFDLDLSNPDRMRARVRNTALTLRGARATVTGDLSLLSARRGAIPAVGRINVSTARHGSLGVELTEEHASVAARAFDLAWIRPIVPALLQLDGVIDGNLRLDPRRVTGSTGELRLTRGSIDPVGAFEAAVTITPEERTALVHATVRAARGGDVTADVRLAPPRENAGAQAWFQSVSSGEVALNLPEVHAWEDVLGLPRGLAADGHLSARILAHRDRATDPLSVTTYVEGRGLTAGVRVLGRVVPAVVPLHARALACAQLSRLSVDETSVRVRLALGVDRPGPTPDATRCDTDAPLLERSLVAFHGGVEGPWASAFTQSRAEVRTRGHRFTAPTRDLLARTRVTGDLHVGPLRRSEWPLRTVAIPGADGRPVMLRPPDVPMDTVADVTAHAAGALLGLRIASDIEARTSSVPQVGLLEPASTALHLEVEPEEGGSLFGPLNLTVGGIVELSPDAPPDTRGEVALDVRARTEGQRLIDEGVEALEWRRFDVDSRHIHIERFAWGRERGVEGEVKLNFVATRDSQSPVDAHVEVDRLRARVGDDDSVRQTAPVQVVLRGKVLRTANEAWTLRTCANVTPTRSGTPGGDAGASAEGQAQDCDPLAEASAAEPGSMRAVLTLPLQGALRSLAPVLERAQVSVRSNAFRIDPIAPVVRGDTVATLEGLLDANLDWNAADAGSVRGRIALNDASTTIVSIGEPLRHLNLALVAEGSTARIERMDVALGRGTLHGDGTIDFRGLQSLLGNVAVAPDATLVRMNLHGVADDLPLGTEGNTYGWVDGAVRYEMAFEREEAHGALTVERAAVLVKEQSSRELQALSNDPSVYVHGRTELAPQRVASWYPITLTFDLETPVWLRRSDFAIALQARGSVHRDRAGWGVAGTIEQASSQCWFSVFGKRFALDRLGIVMDGSVALNPQLDIAAHHDSTSVGRLTLGVRGRLRQPVMEFRSVNYPSASQAEVLAMIVMGRRDTQGSSSQSGDLASQASTLVIELVRDLAIGTATTNLSQRFSFLPTLIVEPGERQRYGAGVSLGPRFYLQATYGTASSATGATTSSSAQQLRLLLEIAMSTAWSTAVFGTIGTSGQQPGSNGGGVDLFWSP